MKGLRIMLDDRTIVALCYWGYCGEHLRLLRIIQQTCENQVIECMTDFGTRLIPIFRMRLENDLVIPINANRDMR